MTGESVPVSKGLLSALPEDTPLAERHNMVLASTVITRGRAVCVVTGTGMDTEMGKIAGALAAVTDEQTPLQRKLDELGRTLSKLVLGICVFIFAFNLITHGEFSLEAILSTFMVAVSLAVAAIPEAWPPWSRWCCPSA